MLSKRDLELRRLGQITLRELSARYGVSQTKIWNVLCCQGLAGQRRNVWRTSPETQRLVLEGAARGLSLRQIGIQVGLSHEQVRQILVRRTAAARPVSRCRRCGALMNGNGSTGNPWRTLCIACLLLQSDYPLNERLRALRLARNWTQQELAEASGVSSSTIFCMESNGHEPGLRTLRKLASALEVSLFTLVGRGAANERRMGAAAV
jgi:transcriptional regulator with XRE-family HTH domain